MERNTDILLKRFYLVLLLLFLFGILILFRLFNLQINGEQYRIKTLESTIRYFDIEPKRGNLYSDDGSLLATSISRYDIRFDAVTVKDSDFEKLLNPLSDSLSVLLKKPASHYKNLLRRAKASKNRYFLIARGLGYSDFSRIKKFPLFNKGAFKGGIIIEQRVVREYPLGGIAQRSVGYERKDDQGNVSRVGLEGAFSQYLAGVKGHQLKQRIAKGQWKPIGGENELEPKDGSDVVSTISVNIQDIAHHALLNQLEKYKADHGCVVVMEVETGEIKAISNLGRNNDDGEYYERLNYAIGEVYEPGSLFKIMSLVTAMEEKSIDTTYMVDTQKGRLTFYGKNVWDSNRRGYGNINVAKAIEVSSNTGIVKMTHDLFSKNPKQFTDRIKAMHLDRPLGLSIVGEGKPYIPQPSDKNWSGISLEWMAFGYGLHLTPLQTLTFYNAIANDGVMVKPRLIKEVKDLNKVIKKFNVEIIDNKICSTETTTKIKAIMENVVKRGTGRKLYSPNFSMAGKTGTAQKNYKNKNKLNYISSFAGFFPANNPKYSCIVVIHEPDKGVGYYGADVSGPVFKSIAHKIYTSSLLIDVVEDIDKVSPKASEDYRAYFTNTQKYKTIMPDLVGMNGMDAIALLENMGLRVKVIGNGKVKKQSVAKGEKVKENTTVRIELS